MAVRRCGSAWGVGGEERIDGDVDPGLDHARGWRLFHGEKLPEMDATEQGAEKLVGGDLRMLHGEPALAGQIAAIFGEREPGRGRPGLVNGPAEDREDTRLNSRH